MVVTHVRKQGQAHPYPTRNGKDNKSVLTESRIDYVQDVFILVWSTTIL